jgi:hypothetical protein
MGYCMRHLSNFQNTPTSNPPNQDRQDMTTLNKVTIRLINLIISICVSHLISHVNLVEILRILVELKLDIIVSISSYLMMNGRL